MSPLVETTLFNRRDQVAKGWYWAFRSSEIKKGCRKPLHFLGRELVVFRGHDGRVRAMDAYCRHMGAHLAEGRVEGDGIRCFFHHWKYDENGQLLDVPAQKTPPCVRPLRTFSVDERYGLIWIWAGDEPAIDVPCPPELQGQALDYKLGRPFQKSCHPNVMMINAIDAQHFASVHRLPVDLHLEPSVVSAQNILFQNTTRVPTSNWYTRFIARFYQKALTYDLSYWYGSTGTVTLGPDFLHFYIVFALRLNRDGKAEGQTILLTKKRRGFFGFLLNRVLLFVTQIVGDYFARGDTRVFESIRFRFDTPIKADAAIVKFIRHLEAQEPVRWGLAQDNDVKDLSAGGRDERDDGIETGFSEGKHCAHSPAEQRGNQSHVSSDAQVL